MKADEAAGQDRRDFGDAFVRGHVGGVERVGNLNGCERPVGRAGTCFELAGQGAAIRSGYGGAWDHGWIPETPARPEIQVKTVA